MHLRDCVRKSRVFAVIRAPDRHSALRSSEACLEGGLKLIEVTFSFAGAEKVISELSGRTEGLVGGGTILNIDMARIAVESGARFIVSPHTDPEIISFAKSSNILVIAGALTSSEIVNAWKMGADMVKIFPVKAVGGASYIRAIKEPLPFVDIMTTGGVTLENFVDLLEAGATAVGLSSALIGGDGSLEPEIIVERAKRVIEEVSRLNERES